MSSAVLLPTAKAKPKGLPIKASPNFVPKDTCPGLVKQMARRSDAQTLTYTCDDFNSNQAPAVTRTIKTLDTTNVTEIIF